MPAEFKTRLKEMRETRGLNQAELAEKAKLPPTTISHFETGSRSPSFDNLRKLADALEVSTDYLLMRTDEPTAVGPGTSALFRHIEGMTDEDRGALESMAEALAQKKKKR